DPWRTEGREGAPPAMGRREEGFGVAPLAPLWEEAGLLSAEGYPFALFQRRFLFQKEAYLIHLYNVLTGLSIAYFNFGMQFFHSLICVLVQFLILRLMGRTVTAVFTTFFFQMAYLMAGYYFTATEHYDIKWTMPHCVLTLKLIGLAIDYYDGGKDSLCPCSQAPEFGPAVPSNLYLVKPIHL
uniref:Uncharacterized protein n=1 Tax=Nothoprocta perdicaria TaxID=30464 RepID=A0A8C6YSW3_NOTPE